MIEQVTITRLDDSESATSIEWILDNVTDAEFVEFISDLAAASEPAIRVFNGGAGGLSWFANRPVWLPLDSIIRRAAGMTLGTRLRELRSWLGDVAFETLVIREILSRGLLESYARDRARKLGRRA